MSDVKIEEVGKTAGKSIKDVMKKHPWLLPAGVVAVVVLALVMRTRKGEEEALVPLYQIPAGTEGGGGAGGWASYTPDLSYIEELIAAQGAESEARVKEVAEQTQKQLSQIPGLIEETVRKYLKEREPAPGADASSVLYEEHIGSLARRIVESPSVRLSPGSTFTLEQLETIAGWAQEDVKAIREGAAGTSKVIMGPGAAGLIQTFKPTGEVVFESKEEWLKRQPEWVQRMTLEEERKVREKGIEAVLEERRRESEKTLKELESMKGTQGRLVTIGGVQYVEAGGKTMPLAVAQRYGIKY